MLNLRAQAASPSNIPFVHKIRLYCAVLEGLAGYLAGEFEILKKIFYKISGSKVPLYQRVSKMILNKDAAYDKQWQCFRPFKISFAISLSLPVQPPIRTHCLRLRPGVWKHCQFHDNTIRHHCYIFRPNLKTFPHFSPQGRLQYKIKEDII